MATSNSLSFAAPIEKVWGAVVKIVNSSGYAVSETNSAAKQIKYQASGGAWAWAQKVTVSVTELGDNETMVTVKAESSGQGALTEGGQQRKLINYLLEKLAEKFQVLEDQPEQSGAPGTSGCLGFFLVIISSLTCVFVSAIIKTIGLFGSG